MGAKTLSNRNQSDSGELLIKICGLTKTDNALECARAGADAIGLVFFDKSPRNVSMDQAKAICKSLPDTIITCGVFVNAPFEYIMDRVATCGLKAVQLHGQEPASLVEKLKKTDLLVIKALFAVRKPSLTDAHLYGKADFILVEYGKGVLPGGNAETWDYKLSSRLDSPSPVILAGGLSPDNIKEAVQNASPSAVDVSSGVEKAPGIKDIKKVEAFIREARSRPNG